MADMTARAETELRISDTYLDAHFSDSSAVIDVVERTPIEAFIEAHRTVPASGGMGRFNIRGISVDQEKDDIDATYSYVNRALLNNGANRNVLRRYVCGPMQPESVTHIYPLNTTARGISVYS